jgi:NAD(P)-dependent dehydrogenase (short-subunit alcohol dehydrogenase family)
VTPTVLITGANRGLGFEFARQYAADGWQVIATCRKVEGADGLRALGPQVRLEQLEVTDLAAVSALGRKLERETIDVFIANAGAMTASPYMKAEAIDEAGWLQDLRVNTIAPLACAAALLKPVARSRQRKMVAMSSGVGSIAGNTAGGKYAYRSAKAALNAVWRSFAVDHPEVIAALLVPGPLRTDMTRYDPGRWPSLPEPAENIGKLRNVIQRLTQADSGGFFRFDGGTVPW